MSSNLNLALTLFANDKASRVISNVMREAQRNTENLSRATQKQAASQAKATELGVQGSRVLTSEFKKLATARETLGVRSEHTIQREIQQTEAAYNRLARSGKMSADEQSRAFSAMQKRVSDLRHEMAAIKPPSNLANWGRGLMQVGAGVAAASMVLKEPIKNQMSYDRQLANLTNTVFAERDIAGRVSGKGELNQIIEQATKFGGGNKEDTIETLNKLVASGVISFDSASNLLPILQKYSTATGTKSTDLADIAINASRFGIAEQDIEKVINMAIVAGKSGSFELKDMAQYLSQQMAAAGSAGMKGLDDFATILSLNQAAAITSGSSSQAGTNTTNLLSILTSRRAANAAANIDYKGSGIDLAGSLAAIREKGVNALDGFVAIVDKVVADNPQYKKLQEKLKTATGAEREETLASMASLLEGSVIGEIIGEQGALRALVGYRANRDYAYSVRDDANKQRYLSPEQLEGNKDFDVMKMTPDFQTERLKNASDFAEMRALEPLSKAIGGVSDDLANLSERFPALSTAVMGAVDAIKLMTGVMISFAGINFLTRGGGVGTPGLFSRITTNIGANASKIASTGGRLLGRIAAPIALWQGANEMPLVHIQRKADAVTELEKRLLRPLTDEEKLLAPTGFMDVVDEWRGWFSKKPDQPAQNETPSPPPVQIIQLELDGRTVAEVVNDWNNQFAWRGQGR